MAVPPPSNDVFLREVDDELRRDQLIDYWRRWGRLTIAAVVAALALFAAFLAWQHHRESVAGQEGEQLSQAYDDIGGGNLKGAGTILATLAGSNRDGYRAMAEFSQADVLLQQKNDQAAAAKLAGIAGNAAYPKPIRDLALIRQTAAEFDRLKPQVAVERLRPLAVAGSPWLGSAGELLAAAYLREGRRDLAAAVFGKIAQGDEVPDTLRQRAVQMAGDMSTDAGASAPASNGAAAPGGDVKAR